MTERSVDGAGSDAGGGRHGRTPVSGVGAGRGAGAARHRRRPRDRHARRPLRHRLSGTHHLSAAVGDARQQVARRHGAHGCDCCPRHRASFKLLGRSQPAVVVGFGGYPTFPPLKAASLRGIPTVLHEQNAVLGSRQQDAGKGVSAIATSFATTKSLDAGLTRKVASHRQPRTRRRDRAGRQPLPCRRDRTGRSAAGVRRQPGRALFLRGRAAGAGAAADGDPASAAGRAAGARRGRRAVCARPIRTAASRPRCRLLRRPA